MHQQLFIIGTKKSLDKTKNFYIYYHQQKDTQLLKQGQQPVTVPSANIQDKIQPINYVALPPPKNCPDNLPKPKDDEEIAEIKALEANNGNPVLPSPLYPQGGENE